MAIESNLFNMLFSGLASDNNVNAVPRRQKQMDQSAMRSRALQDQIRQQQIKQNEYNLGRMGKPTTTVQQTPQGMFEITTDPSGRVISANPVRQGQQTRGVGNTQTPLLPDQMNRPIVGAPAPEKPKRSPSYLKAVDEGLQPGTPAFIKRVQELNNPRGGVTVNTGDQGGPLKGLETDIYKGIVTAAQGAGAQRRKAEQGLELLKARMQAGSETGKWAPARTEAAAWLGVDPEGVATAQAFDVAMGDYVMSRIQETKGAVSEKEMDYFGKISPGSDKEPFTNFALLEVARRAAAREADKAKYLNDYLQQGKPAWQFDEWYMENHDPFPEFSVEQLREQFNQEFGGQQGQGRKVGRFIVTEE